MPRRVQDIVPGDRRSMKEADIVSKRRPRLSEPDPDEEIIPIHKKSLPAARLAPAASSVSPMRRMPVTPPAEPTRARRPRGPHNRLKWLLIALGIIVVVGVIGFIASSYYSRATFTIVPKVIPISVNGTYVAQAVPVTGSLSYEVVTVKGSASSTVPATDGPVVSTKATGKITLYNSFSAATVRLIAGTRFSNEAGLVYRLSSSLVIPGDSTSGGSVVPGKISADLVADQPGQTYNMSKADSSGTLHIVAYTGSSKYDAIYGKLATDLAGGFSGTKKIVSPTTIASSTTQLKSTLTATLLAQVMNVIPDGYIMYDKAYTSTFAQPSIGGAQSTSATVTLSGTLYGILFKKSTLLAKFSSNQSETAFGDFGFTSPGLETLQLTITNLKDWTADKKPSLVIHAKGDMKLVGTIPVDEIKKKLEGISLAATQDVFKSYSPVIESGSGELVPPWAKIPSDPKRITVTVTAQ